MLKQALKLAFFAGLIIISFVAIFTYQIFSAGQKIFSQNPANPSIFQQFNEMIFSPTEKLKGENEGRINILFLGLGGEKHSGGELTDTIIIAGIDPSKKEAALLSIPRDLYVQIPEIGVDGKINAVKALGDKSYKKNGIDLLQKTIKEVSGLNIHYFVQLDFDGFTKIVDDVGGIDIELEESINDPIYPNFNNGYDPFFIEKGWHHLDGATALKVARSRHSKMGDFDRIKRQQAIIKSFKQKVFDKYAKFDVIAFADIVSDLGNHLRTNIELGEIPRLYKLIKEIKSHNITAATIDTKSYLDRTYVGLGYTLQPKENDYEKIKELSASLFDIEISQETKNIIAKEKASLEIQNGTGSLDLANIVSKDFEELGFRIINSTNIELPDFSGVRIYDNSNGSKSNTLKFLKEKFSAAVIEIPASEASQADFVIALGKGF